MSLATRVVHKRRETITSLPLYYSGHLLKKLSKEKDFKKYFAELRGATLFLYTDDTQDTYTEKLDLEQLKSMMLESPYQRKEPTIFTLKLHTQEVQLKMDNADTGEEWRGYILTVVKQEIPSKLQLLPGQMLLLREALDKERRRNPRKSRPPLPPRPSFPLPASPSPSPPEHKSDKSDPEIPTCFFNVTRQEAERMLEANPEYGGIILRPSTLANNYALTFRQVMPSGPVMRNFRVTSTQSGFVIELDTAVTVSSLNDVLKYFLEKTEYRLHPYTPSQPYEQHIDVPPAPKCVSVDSPKPKTVPWAPVASMPSSQSKEVLPPQAEPKEGEYVIPDDHNLKQGHLDEELREILKLRRENLYSAKDEEIPTYVNHTTEKSPPGTAQWNTKSPAV